MKPTVSAIQRLLLPVALMAFAAPGWAQPTLSVNPSSLQFPHVSTQWSPQQVTVRASDNQPHAFTFEVQYETGPGGVNPGGWLTTTVGNLNSPVAVAVTTSPGGVTLPQGTYTATIIYSAAGAHVSLPVNMTVGSGGGTTTLVSPSVLNLTSASPNSTLLINAPPGVAYTSTVTYGSGSGWLSTPSGWTTSSQTPVAVSAYASALAPGTYQASLNFTVNGQPALVAVTLTVSSGGSSGGLTLSTTNLNYTLPQTNSNDPSAIVNFAEQFTLNSSISRSVDLRSTASWLATTPANSVSLIQSVPLGFAISLDPRGLVSGNHTGAINIYEAGTSTLIGSINVVLTVGSAGFVSPTSFSYAVLPGSTTPDIRTFTVTGSGNVVVSYTNDTPGAGGSYWLQVPSTGGTTSALQPFTFTASINPTGLAVGTYTGRISVSVGGQTPQVIPVTLTVGTTGPSGIVSPNPISLSSAVGGFTSGTLTISPGIATSYEILTPGVTWLTFSNASGYANPTAVVTLNASAAGLSASTYTTVLTVRFPNSGIGDVQVPVTFNVGTGGGGGGGIVSPTSLSFQSVFGGGTQTQLLNLSAAAGSFYNASVSTTTGQNWLTVSPISGTVFSGTTLSVTVNPFGLVDGAYSGQVFVTVNGSTQTIPVSLVVGAGGGSGLLSPSTLTFNVAQSSSQSQTVNLLANPNVFFSASASTTTGANWLSVLPVSGLTTSTQTPLTVSVNTFGLLPGTYTGQVQVNVNGTTQSVIVTLNVGGTGGGTVSPSALTFTSTVNGPEQSQQVSLNTTAGVSFQVTNSTNGGGNWLSASPSNGFTGSTSHPISIIVNPFGLAAGTYTGQVAISFTGGNATIPVTLVVGGGGASFVSPAVLTFSGSTGGSSVTQSLHMVTATGTSYTAVASVANGGWLTVSPANGTTSGASTTLMVTANPAGLSPGTYTGQVAVTAGGTTQTIPVTLVVSAGAGGVVSPSTLTYNALSGGATQTQTLTLSAPAGAFFSASATTTTGASWLFVTPGSGTTASSLTTLTVTVNPFGLANGTYTGTVTVVVSGQSYSVPVTLNVGTTGGVISPSSLAFTVPVGGNTTPQTLTLNTTAGTFFNVVSTVQTGSVNWLLVTPNNGIASTNQVTLSVSVLPAGLAAGTYQGQIRITANAVDQTIPVTLTVGTGSSSLTANPNALAFTATTTTTPAAQTVQINSLAGTTTFTTAASTTTGQNWLLVTPATGSAPGQIQVSVNPTGLTPGTYQGTITLSVAFVPILQIPVTLTVSQSAAPSIRRVQNAASYSEQGVSPGMLVVLDVQNLNGPSTVANMQVNAQNMVATTLAGTRVLFDGYEAPLVYVVNNFVSAIVPYEIGSRATTSIIVEKDGVRSAAYEARVLDAAPGVFTMNASGVGQGSITNQDGTVNSAGNPARRGQYVVMYFTGEGLLTPPGVTGGIAPISPLRPTVNEVRVRVGGVPARTIFAGAVPTLVYGVGHVSFFIPEDAAVGSSIPVDISVGGRLSQAGVTIAIAQ